MVTELGWPVSNSSTGSQNFMPPFPSPITLNTSFIKKEIKNWLTIGFSLIVLIGTCTHYHNTMFNRWLGESLGFIHPSIESWNNPGDISLPWNCQCSQIPHPSTKVASTCNRTKINHHRLNHLQTLHTH